MPPVDVKQDYHTPQVRIELTLNDEITSNEPATVTINAANEQTAKQLVVRMLGSETKFFPRDNGQGYDISHPKILGGKQPFGWMAQFNVPTRFGVKSAMEYRLSEKQVA